MVNTMWKKSHCSFFLSRTMYRIVTIDMEKNRPSTWMVFFLLFTSYYCRLCSIIWITDGFAVVKQNDTSFDPGCLLIDNLNYWFCWNQITNLCSGWNTVFSQKTSFWILTKSSQVHNSTWLLPCCSGNHYFFYIG